MQSALRLVQGCSPDALHDGCSGSRAQAAKSSSHAETAAQEATNLARRARTQAAVEAAGAACQSFHQARGLAGACACTQAQAL